MVRSKKNFLWIIVSMFCMLTSLFFIGCGEIDLYKDVKLISSQDSISLYVGQSTEVEYTIENYFEGMDNTISFSVVDSAHGSSSSEITGEHVSLKLISKNDNKIKISLTGVSSGRTSVIATTKEGMKKCSLDVVVKQYSKNFAVNDSKNMYVSLGQTIYPSSDYFVFDEGTTERDIEFYYVPDENADLTGKEFTTISLKNVNGQNTLYFLNDNGSVSSNACEYDGQNFTFLAVYKYMEYDESGNQIEVAIKRLTKVVALFGIDKNDVQIYGNINDVLNYEADVLKALDKNNLNIELVANKNDENSRTYFVTVPVINNGLVNFEFDCVTSNKSALSLGIRDITADTIDPTLSSKLSANNLKLYQLTVSTNSFSSLTTDISLKVYYAFADNSNLASETNQAVSYVINIPVVIKLMPEIVQVVDADKVLLADNNGSNSENEVFYNHYVSDYGWEEYYVNVYKPSSTYEGVKVTFDYMLINVKYNGRTFNATDSFVMTDLSQPIYVRGVENSEAVVGDIKFTVQSELFEEGEDLSATLNYEIKDGASRLTYKTTSLSSQANGLYVSSSVNENIFVDIYADKEFKSFSLETLQAGIASVGDFQMVEDEGKYYLQMVISPIKVGEANYIVRLDNGVSTQMKVKVVNTFDDMSIALLSNNADVVSNQMIKQDVEGEIVDVLEVVVRNAISADKTAIIYGKRANFEILSSHTDAILNIVHDFKSLGIATLLSSSALTSKTVETLTKGETIIEFEATGYGVSNFVLNDDVLKSVFVKIISFVPVSEMNAYRVNPLDNTTMSAEKIVVFPQADGGSEKTNSAQIVSNSAYINIDLAPRDAYYFYDVKTQSYVSESDAEKFVYWTLSDGVYAYDTQTRQRTEMLQFGSSYYISGREVFNPDSYYGIFEFDPVLQFYKFTANPDVEGAIFTMYATIRQYGLKKYVPIQIECREFVAVEQIYTTEILDTYSFKNADEKLEFVVYLNPYEATVSGITCVFVGTSGFVSVEDDITITKLNTTTSIAYLVSVQLDEEVVNSLTNVNKTYAGTLYIIPNDWYNSNYSDLNGVDASKLTQILSVNINFQNGTRANPYVLETYEDVLAIGSSSQAMSSHYIVYDLIDMSKAIGNSNYLIDLIINTSTHVPFTGSIRGATENAGFENITNSLGLFHTIGLPSDGGYSLDNLIFKGSFDFEISSSSNIGLIAGTNNGKVYNITTTITKDSTINFKRASTTTYLGTVFGINNKDIIQDFKRDYIELAGSLIGSERYTESGVQDDNGTFFKIGTTLYPISENIVTIDGVEYSIKHIVKTMVYSEKSINLTGTGTIYAGGVVGSLSTGSIKKIDDGQKHFNYASYTVYTNIQASGTLTAYLGGVASNFNSGTIDGVLVGGKVRVAIRESSSDYVGGFVARMANSGDKRLTNSTSRMVVRGYNVGAIVGYLTTAGTNTFNNLKIEAIDDGIAEGFEVAMVQRLANITSSDSDPNAQDSKLNNILVSNNDVDLASHVTIKSYVVSRGQIAYYNTDVNGKIVYSSTTTTIEKDEYYGDCVLINYVAQGVGQIVAVKVFDKVDNGGVDVSFAEGQPQFKENGTLANATIAYHFSAEAYYENGVYVYSNIIEKQELLDECLNTLYSGKEGYPFTASGESIIISSESANISIDNNGNILIKDSGLAVISFSTILNRMNSIKVYLYVVNYFDVKTYVGKAGSGNDEAMFFVETLPILNETSFNVISDQLVNVRMNAKTEADIVRKDGGAEYTYSAIAGGVIAVAGVNIKLENANKMINYDIAFEEYEKATGSYDADGVYYTFDGTTYTEVETNNEADFNAGNYFVEREVYGEISRYDDGFFFSKLAGAETTKDSFDLLDIHSYLSFEAEGKTFVLDLSKSKDVKASYYEGATSLTTNYSAYVVMTGKEFADTVYISSDTDEDLIVELQNEDGGIVSSNLIEDTSQLFNVYCQKVNIKDNPNCFNIIVAVNKFSDAFKNRYSEEIYGKYKLKYYSSSRGENGVYKIIDVIYEEQQINTISVISYNNIEDVKNGTAVESKYVVPAQFGVLAVSLAPIDADFDYICVENTDVNRLPGSSTASFVVGYIDTATNNFIEISGAIMTADGIRIPKQTLEKIENYNGSFYVKYIFGSYEAENDVPVEIAVRAYHNDDLICENILDDLKINIKYDIGLRLNGYNNKTEVARGLTYDLEVINTGFNAQSIEVSIPEQYANTASLSEDGTKLIISNNVIDYADGEQGKLIEVKISVEYINAAGALDTYEKTLELTVLEYVVNYAYAQEDSEDIISGMTNGVISTAVGEKTTLSVDFNNFALIEYNIENTEVKGKIDEFIDDLNSNGTWMSYVDVNSSGVQIYPNPIQDLDQSVKKQFNLTSNFSNIYFSNTGLSFRTKRTHGIAEGHYRFTYQGYYKIVEGVYEYSATPEDSELIHTDFTFDSFVRGSDDHPNPIYDYDDLKGMNATAHYILLNDIYITSENFEPLTTAIASLDGNGYKFIFSNYQENPDNLASVYDMTQISQIGVFSSVSENTVLKNITVQIGDKTSGDVVFNLSPTGSYTIGLVAADNSGVITNACVTNFDSVNFTIANNASSSSMLGGLVGTNSGYLSHSRSYMSVNCSFNTAGVVASNSGRISSTFYKGGKILNEVASATTSIYTAGFAITNSGVITTSYTSGDREDIHYDTEISWSNLDYNISSNVQSAGFVYSNNANAEISDCYSNLIVTSKSQSAGFVYVNDGLCKNSFSFGLVNPSSTTDYGFAGGDSLGTFEECYYLRSETYNINKSQNFTTIIGVNCLDIEEFDIANNDYSAFSFANVVSDNFVWYFSKDLGRLQLVDANIIAFSQKEINEEETSLTEDGTYIYSYETSVSASADGSRENPYVISSPDKFQTYLAQGSTAGKHYRIVCDLDYQDYSTDYITTYNSVFAGYLYGNGITISNISLYSDESMESAGLFSQIVGQASINAFVKDLVLKPAQVSFANANYVGTLAGKISYADITNIVVLGTSSIEVTEEDTEEDVCVVIGKNVVGGLVGIGLNSYSINNITSKISTMASYITTTDDYITPTRDETNYLTSRINVISFSGSIAGFLGGNGSAKNLEIKRTSLVSIGSSAGLFFGFVGKNATVNNLETTVSANMLIRASIYGGLVAGGAYGNIGNVVINGTVGQLELFSKIPYIPQAVGGVAGYVSGSTISNVYIGQGLVMPSKEGIDFDDVDAVGGIAGLVSTVNNANVTINNVIVDASFTASNNLGGVIGRVEKSAEVILREIAVKENSVLTLKGRYSTPSIGGFIGLCSGYLYLYDSYSKADFVVDSFDYDSSINLGIGELFGRINEKVDASVVDLTLVKKIENVYTNNTYSVRLRDLSATDNAESTTIADGDIDDYTTGSFSAYCINVYNFARLTGFSHLQKDGKEHQVKYSLLENSQSDFDQFAKGLSETVWQKTVDTEDVIVDATLAFENNLKK